jgi:uncharacterized peroxidase-related enzyme
MEHHGAALHLLTKDHILVEQLKEDYTKANLTPKMLAMLQYAEQLTKRPASVEKENVEVLKRLGCSDREVLDLCQITAYFNFVNRLAEGLGIELENTN